MNRTLTVLVALLALAGCARPGGTARAPAVAPASPSQPATFPVAGTLQLPLGAFMWDDVGGVPVCTGWCGGADIHAGTQVTIGDAHGTILAVAQLAAGRVDGPNTPRAVCELPFNFPAVAYGLGPYPITIAHRGSVYFTEADLAAPVKLTL